MECFIKKVWEGKGDEVHDQFIRFGKGHYKGRAVLVLMKTGKIKLKGSFEWANDFSEIISELGGGKVSGVVLSKSDISSVMSENNIQGNSESKKGGMFYKNNIVEQELSKEQIKLLIDNSYFSLLDADADNLKLKIKKKLPKPGKKEEKVDDKFCQLELELKYWPQIKEAFMLPECKRCRISHEVVVEEIILPEGEKDFAKIRELSKRKGKIIRNMEVDKQESKEEKDFIA